MDFIRSGFLLALTSCVLGYEIFISETKRVMDYTQAFDHCASLGAHLATKDELEELRRAGYSMCRCGWTLDKTAHYPMTHAKRECGGRAGLHRCNWGNNQWHAYCFRGDSTRRCSSPLGVQNGTIHHSQLYASSEFHSRFPLVSNSKWSASIARLHNTDLVNAWIPKINGRHQWLEVDLEQPAAVTGILTQGASRYGTKMWVTTFQIKHSKDGINYKTIPKVFAGNSNNNGIKRNMFPEPVIARYIRFVPLKYHYRIALRLELMGCDLETYGEGISNDEDAEGVTHDPFLDYVAEDVTETTEDLFLEYTPPVNATDIEMKVFHQP